MPAPLGRNPPTPVGGQGDDTRNDIPPVNDPQKERDDDLLDTASSTHPFNRIPRGSERVDSLPPCMTNMPHNVSRGELRRMIREELPAGDPNQVRGIHKSSPLTREILQHPIPVGFKLPSMESYDGTTDPYEHVDHFRTMMRIQRAPEAILCQVFPVILKGQARTWFYSLPASSIKDFNSLARLFVDQFVANRRIIKDSSHLSGIRQHDGETLKEFFHRFTTEARQIPGVDPELLRGVFLGGLRPGPFYSALMRDTVRTYADLIHRVEAQITADEAINSHRRQFEQNTVKRRVGSEPVGQPPQKKKPDQASSRYRNTIPDRSFTPLNTSRTNILMNIRDNKILKWPQPLRPDVGNQEQYCHYHRGRGHNTENCIQLKQEIERLLQQGYLGNFMQRHTARQNDSNTKKLPANERREGERQVVGEIQTIAGASFAPSRVFSVALNESMNKKLRVDHSITFDDSDMEGVQTPHQDPLVISAGIGDPCYNVRRILIDNGSSVDVLFYSTFLNLGLKPEKLQATTGSLYGFDNQPVQVEGAITLPVTLGEFPR